MGPKRHTFTIADKIDTKADKPFGQRYEGSFVIRKPTLGDQGRIACLAAAQMNQYGAGGDRAGDFWRIVYSAFATLQVVSEESPPKWWDLDKMEEEQDERAILAVWEEVSRWLNSFRSPGLAPAGGS